MWELLMAVDPSTTVDLAPALQQIGIGILIAVPAYVTCWQLWKRLDRALSECSRLQQERVAREVELSTGTVPVMAQSVDLLSKVPESIRAALSEATGTIRSSDLERALRRVEQAAERLPKVD